MIVQIFRVLTLVMVAGWFAHAAAQTPPAPVQKPAPKPAPKSAAKPAEMKGPKHAWFVEANKEVGALLDGHQFEQALQKNTALLERVKKEFGPRSFDAAVVLATQGHIYSAARQPGDAASIYAESLQMMEKLFGPVHPQVAIMQSNLARVYGDLHRIDEGKALFEKAMSVAERASGKDSDTVRQVLNLYAVFTANYVDKALAQQQIDRLIPLTRKVLGPNSSELINAQVTKARILAVQGLWAEMDAYIAETVDKTITEHGEQDTFTLQIMADLADLLRKAGRFDSAVALSQRLVALCEKYLGPDNRFTVAKYVQLANTLQEKSDHAGAIVWYEKAIPLLPKLFGDQQAAAHNLYLRYGRSLRKRSRFEDAENAFLTAIRLSDKAFGELNVYNVMPRIDLAGLYKELGRLREAEQLYKGALEISVKVNGGRDHDQTALILDNLGVLYGHMGQPAEAEKYSGQSLEMYERLYGPENRDVAYVLNNLSSVFTATGRQDDAIQYTTRALTIVGKDPALKDDPISGILLDNLAGIFSNRGNLGKAEEYHTKAYEFFVRTTGKDSPDTAIAAHNIGEIKSKLKDYPNAESWYREGLAINEKVYGKRSQFYARSLKTVGVVRHLQNDNDEALRLLDEALEICLAVLPADHPETIDVLVDKGDVHRARGEFQAAYDAYARASESIIRRQDDAQVEADRQRALRGLIEIADKLEDAAGADRKHFLITAFSAAQRLGNSKTSGALAQMSARFAGGGGALAEIVRNQQDLAAQLTASEAKLTTALGAEQRDNALIEYLRRQREGLSGKLSKLSEQLEQDFPAYAELSRPKPLAVADLQKQLAPDELFIEYTLGEEGSYAWVIGPGTASWYRLPMSEAEIGKHVSALRCGLETSGWSRDAKDVSCEQLLERRLMGPLLPFDFTRAHQLYKAIIGPFENDIAGKQLIIVPSGALTSLPFQVLVSKPSRERFVVDLRAYASQSWLAKSNAITILPAASNLKALRQFARASASSAPYVGYGDPKLAGSPQCGRITVPETCETPADPPGLVNQVVASLQTYFRSAQADTIAVSSLCPLPDTAHELKCVAQSLGAGAETIHTGLAATERLLKSASEKGELERYRIVHFATHGLLAGETNQVDKSLSEPALVLSPPDKPSPEDDGLLTASEVAQLKLNADWVVLSACNTAGGDQPGAEALSGLARAFFYAGARALLVSHWPVNSTAAVKLTTGAFSVMRHDPKVGRAEAMRRSISALIDRGRAWEAHPSYWAPFIVVGEGGAAK